MKTSEAAAHWGWPADFLFVTRTTATKNPADLAQFISHHWQKANFLVFHTEAEQKDKVEFVFPHPHVAIGLFSGKSRSDLTSITLGDSVQENEKEKETSPTVQKSVEAPNNNKILFKSTNVMARCMGEALRQVQSGHHAWFRNKKGIYWVTEDTIEQVTLAHQMILSLSLGIELSCQMLHITRDREKNILECFWGGPCSHLGLLCNGEKIGDKKDAEVVAQVAQQVVQIAYHDNKKWNNWFDLNAGRPMEFIL